MDQENKEQAIIEELKAKARKTSCCKRKHKLSSFNWLKDLPQGDNGTKMVEVSFKNTRKDFYENVNDLPLEEGEIIAVEASPGHDIGKVTMTGPLVLRQMKRKLNQPPKDGFKKIYRKARPADIEKWEEAQALEHQTMIDSRRISDDLNLNMKIGDVEYQGDKTKAIFYYIADERVDFRELIKVLADRFKIRVEMRQIGARQEAGRIGGIGSCGRELCCSSHMAKFISVTTTVARYQELSLNPQKLAGQCGKLKCCLNYEVDSYADARKDFPDTNIRLQFEEGSGNHIKTDVYKRLMWYVVDDKSGQPPKIVTIPVDGVNEVLKNNKKGKKVSVSNYQLKTEEAAQSVGVAEFGSEMLEEDLTRFDALEDKVDNKQNKRKPNRNKNRNRQGGKDQRGNYQKQNRSNRDEDKKDNKQGGNKRNQNRPNRQPKNDNRRNNENKDNRQNNKPNPKTNDSNTPKNETKKFKINKQKRKPNQE